MPNNTSPELKIPGYLCLFCQYTFYQKNGIIESQKENRKHPDKEQKRKGNKMKNMTILNRHKPGDSLLEIEFTPKGKKETISVYVYAKDRLEASNYLILNHIWGKQHRITYKSLAGM